MRAACIRFDLVADAEREGFDLTNSGPMPHAESALALLIRFIYLLYSVLIRQLYYANWSELP